MNVPQRPQRSVFESLRSSTRLPLLIPYLLTSERSVIDADITRWNAESTHDELLGHLSLPAFRSLYYWRIIQGDRPARVLAKLLSRVWRPEPTMMIAAKSIGPGLFIQHGYCTLLTGVIGANCWVLHGVTLGHVGANAPVIGDDVMIGAGAKVIGKVRVGDGVKVGANAVVVKDVEAGCTVVPAPVRVLEPKAG